MTSLGNSTRNDVEMGKNTELDPVVSLRVNGEGTFSNARAMISTEILEVQKITITVREYLPEDETVEECKARLARIVKDERRRYRTFKYARRC